MKFGGWMNSRVMFVTNWQHGSSWESNLPYIPQRAVPKIKCIIMKEFLKKYKYMQYKNIKMPYTRCYYQIQLYTMFHLFSASTFSANILTLKCISRNEK